MKKYIQRMIRLIFGLFLCSFGTYLGVQANIGLAPWEAFHLGISYITNISMGNVVIIAGISIVAIDFFLGEKIGIGTLLNAILIGVFLNVLIDNQVIPEMNSVWKGIGMLVLGLFFISLGSYFYIGAELGCGPRDSLMVALYRRFPQSSIGVLRTIIEGVALLIGYICGAKIGVGTIVAVLGIGPIMQNLFRILKFQIKELKHENIYETFTLLKHI